MVLWLHIRFRQWLSLAGGDVMSRCVHVGVEIKTSSYPLSGKPWNSSIILTVEGNYFVDILAS